MPDAWETGHVELEEAPESKAAAVAFLGCSQDGRRDCGCPWVEVATPVVVAGAVG